jgi:uncharacterized protein with PIN domain
LDNNDVKFIVDNMLGSLSRWLRILGYDTVYHKDFEDWKILQIAEEENRYIVTRDRGLHRRALNKGLKSIYLWMDELEERLSFIALNTGIKLSVDFNNTRCPEDNTPLRKVSRQNVKDRVPEKVYKLHEDFWECPRCGKVYWIGRHWRMIEKVLETARKKLEENRVNFKKGIIDATGSP